MSEGRACRLLPYARQLVRLAVCDVLEQEGCLDFVRDGPAGTELSVSITRPRPGLSPEGRRRAENYLADRVAQLMENELQLEPLAATPAKRGDVIRGRRQSCPAGSVWHIP